MSRGEIRAALGESRLHDLRTRAAELELSDQEYLRRIVDDALDRRKIVGWSYPAATPTLLEERSDRDVPGFVYLMEHQEQDLYKIGFSVSPRRRVEEVAKAEGAAVELICSIPAADMRALERELHQQYREKRIRGEWFRLSQYDIAAIVALSKVES